MQTTLYCGDCKGPQTDTFILKEDFMSKDLKSIIQPKDDTTLWRYMNFEKFADILATESLFFSRADKYDDKFEGYIPESIKVSYESAGSRIDPNNFRPYIMCHCWHHGREESMAMWDKYHLRNKRSKQLWGT